MHPVLNIALRAAREASRIIVQATARPDLVKVFEKSRNDYVTDIDRRVEKTLMYHIGKAYPGHGFLCEESGHTPGTEADTLWLIDPIDGTRNFILGFPHFCISMACIQRSQIQHALIVDPIRGEEFHASRGGGARLNDTRIRVGSKTTLENATISLSCAGLKNAPALLKIQENLLAGTGPRTGSASPNDERLAPGKGIGSLRFTGSAALDLAYVAAGRLDGGWITGVHKWDVAAGMLLVSEAGGLVSDPGGNPDCLESDTIVFSNPRCLKRLLKAASG